MNFARDGVDLEWRSKFALRRLQVRNMESASSANEGASRRIFDSILDPFESESQLGSTRDRATSGQQQESRESVNSILKRL